MEQLKKVEYLMSAFPHSWHKKRKEGGDRVAECLFEEIETMHSIIGTHLDRMNGQDLRNKEARERKESVGLPHGTTATTYVIVSNKATPQFKTKSHKELWGLMKAKEAYELFHLTDDMMNVDGILDPKKRSKARTKFLEDIKFGFPVRVYKLQRYGSTGNWAALFRMYWGDGKRCDDFEGFVINAMRQVPMLLSQRQTKDAVKSIAMACDKGVHAAKALLMAVLPNGTFPSFWDDAQKKQFLEDTAKMILQADGDDDELELIMDMCTFNGAESNRSLFLPFWDVAGRVLEEENGSGAHNRRHAAADNETTNAISYASGIVSVPQLCQKTIEKLMSEGKVEGHWYHNDMQHFQYLHSSSSFYMETQCHFQRERTKMPCLLTRKIDYFSRAYWNSHQTVSMIVRAVPLLRHLELNDAAGWWSRTQRRTRQVTEEEADAAGRWRRRRRTRLRSLSCSRRTSPHQLEAARNCFDK